MPPGRALVEVLFGRSGLRLERQKAPPGRQAGKNVPRQDAQHHAYHTSKTPHGSSQTSAQAGAASASSANGRLINRLAEIFSPLLHAPGVTKAGTARAIAEPAVNGAGRRLLLNRAAGLHTAARPRGTGGFGNLRPNALPRSTNQMGLGSARNFSSSRTVFENVVQNAPLGLRILGDKDHLDMRSFRREMRRAYLKKRKQEAAMGKGKGKALFCENDFIGARQAPAGIEDYFPIDQEAFAATQPSVQLVLPLDPVSDEAKFMSLNEDAEESRFFSAMLMSDLRLLHDMYGRHHARLRNLIAKLESAGCFDPDEATGWVSVKTMLDEENGRLVVTFYGHRWTMADVRQVLGHYETRATWFELIDVKTQLSHSGSEDDLRSLPSSLPSEFGDEPDYQPMTRVPSFDGCEVVSPDAQQAGNSFHMPSYESIVSASSETHSMHTLSPTSNSYLQGVEGFLTDLESSRRPTFHV
ncbi:hypothetical protein P389DRAFT_97975 [Cystobasidium minutum MCA 4210]|uniref:uncharacterized protein n=1 Tax=Cystobasidium minutum MCA 4210 TaxID=1397322 RepID=UPI0034CDBD0C|eukprot:jgi/Rhomi1/97975/CE97974_3590